MNKWLTPKGITSIIAMIAALAGAIVITSTYITLPKEVDAMEEEIYDIKKYIHEQQIANKLLQEMQQRQYPQRNRPPAYPPPPRECWDQYYQEWYLCEDDHE